MADRERMPTWRMTLYAVGQFGSSLIGYVVGTLLTYFYLPPETGLPTFPVLVSQKAIVGGMTVVGLAAFLGGLIGLVVDPMIGTLSDRSKARMGRRRFFMLIGAVPFAVFSVLVFTPPVGTAGPLNAAWVFAAVLIFNIVASLYRLPWVSLQPELGLTSKDRMLLSTLGSVAWIGGVLAGYAIFPVKELLQAAGFSPLVAFRLVVVSFAVIGGVTMLFPVLFVDERRFGSGKVSEEKPMVNIRLAFGNRDFVVNTAAQTVYVMADTLLQIAMVYFITVLLGFPESMAFTLGAVLVFLSFVWYPFVNIIAARTGKKRFLMVGFGIQAVIFVLFSTTVRLGFVPVWLLASVIIFLQSIVAAITGIVPGAINSDIIRADSIRTGVHKEASFSGAATLISKIPGSLPALVFPSFLLLGRSTQNPMGVRLTAIVSFFIMIAAMIVFGFYNERRTIATLAVEETALPARGSGSSRRR